MENAIKLDRIEKWDNLSNPLKGLTGLGRHMATELCTTGVNFPHNPNLSTKEQVMSAGRSLINNYDEQLR